MGLLRNIAIACLPLIQAQPFAPFPHSHPQLANVNAACFDKTKNKPKRNSEYLLNYC